ncbi:MAG TPA: glycolate oxidase subunit GlcE [Steroidobacteraceae bacterium]|nr:glycolate oxidase subunit GlcE [Steroidobacteraceae bacterium]
METELLKLRERVLVARAQRTPLQLHGARTKDFYGEAITGEPVDVSGYRGIIDYEPSELVMTARCGTPLSDIETALAERGQFLGFEPPRPGGDPTIGGIIATGLSGPRRMQAGAARDFVLGAHLLAGDGEVLRFGGQVMKNVAGFDVSRLLCGSMGIFGIITQLSIKVLPKPRAEETLRLEIPARQAVEAFNLWGGQPLPISGAAWHEGAAWVRLSGAEPAVHAARAVIGGDRVFPALARRWWDALRHYTHPVYSGDSVWRISVPSIAPPLQLPFEPLIDWGGALRWYSGDVSTFDVRGLALAAGGTAMRWRGEGSASKFHPLPRAILEIHRRLKRSFDPEGIFNPGRLLVGL